MTNKLIKSIIAASAIIIFCKMVIIRMPTIKEIIGLLGIAIFVIGFIMVIAWMGGEFDDFFKKYTDPKLQKFCNWINRRNGTEC